MTWMERQQNMKWARDNLFLEKAKEKIVNKFFAVILEDDNEKKKQTKKKNKTKKAKIQSSFNDFKSM